MKRLYISFADRIEQYFKIDARYFLSGGFWLTLTQIISIAAGILTTSLFAHYLSETEYGTYRYLIGLAALFSSFSLTGLGQSILQTAAKKYYAFYQETIRLNFFYSLSVTAISLIGSTYYFINENITLSLGCLLIALLQPIINTFQNTIVFLQGSRRFKESTTAQGIKILTTSLISVFALYFTQNVLVLLLTYLAINTLTSTLIHYYYRPESAPATPAEVTSTYLQYAKNTSVRNIIFSVSNRLDTVLVFTQLGAVELAIYTIATIIPEQIKGSFKNLAALLLPKYAKHEDTDSLKRSVPKRSLQLFIVLLLITLLYITVAPYIYGLLFPKYDSAVLLSQISALAFPAFVLLIPYSILQAQLAETELHKITLYGSISQISLLLILVFCFGLMGAVIARVLYRFTILIIVYILLIRKIDGAYVNHS